MHGASKSSCASTSALAHKQTTKEIRHGQIRQEGAKQSQEGNARAQGGHAQKRPLGEKGQEPQAGDRNRTVGSKESGGQGPEKIIVEQKDILIQTLACRQKEGFIHTEAGSETEGFGQKEVLVQQKEVVVRRAGLGLSR
jgi:hypothetical protein